MRPHQVFAAMSDERAERFFERLRRDARPMFEQVVVAAAAANKSRPAFLRKQPFERRVRAVRRALARVGSDPMAEELLAVYFLDCRKPLLIEWLDTAGIAHEDGVLQEDEPAQPEPEVLRERAETFRSKDDDEDRELLLRAFACQSSVQWPELDALLRA